MTRAKGESANAPGAVVVKGLVDLFARVHDKLWRVSRVQVRAEVAYDRGTYGTTNDICCHTPGRHTADHTDKARAESGAAYRAVLHNGLAERRAGKQHKVAGLVLRDDRDTIALGRQRDLHRVRACTAGEQGRN